MLSNNHYTQKPVSLTQVTQLLTSQSVKKVIAGLALVGSLELAKPYINNQVDLIKFEVSDILNKEFGFELDTSKMQVIHNCIERVKKEHGNKPNYEEILYSELRNIDFFNSVKFLQSLILVYLFSITYGGSFNRVIKKYLSIDAEAFTSFSIIGGGMVLVNGTNSGSMVYLASFILAGKLVYHKLSNDANGRDGSDEILNDSLNRNPMPTTRIDEINGELLVWNAAMEKATGVSKKQVMDYMDEIIEHTSPYGTKFMGRRGEYLTMFYEGPELEKAINGVTLLKSGQGYDDLYLTMNKLPHKPTFSWSSYPNGNGKSTRYARLVTDELKIAEANKRLLAQLENSDYKINERVKNSKDEIIRTGEKGRPIAVSDAMVTATNGEVTLEILQSYFDEIIEHTNSDGSKYTAPRGEYFTMLYEGEELERVKSHVKMRQLNGKGYDDIAFTMNKLKSKPTFSWNSHPDTIYGDMGGDMRVGKLLKNEEKLDALADTTRRLQEAEEKLKLTRYDSLTGALTKKALHEDIDAFNNKEGRKGPKTRILAVIDLDGFKGINDVLGHDVGDEVLKAFGKYIKENIREGDNFYRTGGDEFVIIFDDDDIEAISKKVDELREGFYRKIFDYLYNGKSLQIGSSWGIERFSMSDFHSKNIIGKADNNLYAVKYFKLIMHRIKRKLKYSGIDISEILEKNGLVHKIYGDDGEILGYKVVKGNGVEFELSIEDLNLINYIKERHSQKVATRSSIGFLEIKIAEFMFFHGENLRLFLDKRIKRK